MVNQSEFRKRQSLSWTSTYKFVIAALIISAISGLLISWLTYRFIDDHSYVAFSIFWGWLYFGVGAVSGIQQEIARASSTPAHIDQRNWKLLGIWTLAAGTIITSVSFSAWAITSGNSGNRDFFQPIIGCLGIFGYVFIAAACGALYGLSQWRILGFMIAIDGLARLCLVAISLKIGAELPFVELMVVLPFILIALGFVISLAFGKKLRNSAPAFDVNFRKITLNAFFLMAASASMAILISGFQGLMGLALGGMDDALFGQVAFSVMILRAPLVIAVLSVQSLLIVQFRNRPKRRQKRLLFQLLGLLFFIAVCEWVVISMFGTQLFISFTGKELIIPGIVITSIVASGFLLGVMFTIGSSLVARSRHGWYLASWLLAVCLTLAILLSPIELLLKLNLALVVPVFAAAVFQIIISATDKAKSNELTDAKRDS